jgi:hypothetical protein
METQTKIMKIILKDNVSEFYLEIDENGRLKKIFTKK